MSHDVPPDPPTPPPTPAPPPAGEPEVKDPPKPGQTPPVSEPPKHARAGLGVLLATMLAGSGCAAAQGASPPEAARGAASAPVPSRVDPKMVKPAPQVDPRAVRQPPPQGDPDIARQPPAEKDPSAQPRRPATPAAGMSREDDCRGPAELCKQDSAR